MRRITVTVLALVVCVACGDDADTKKESPASAGGAGGGSATASAGKTCGGKACALPPGMSGELCCVDAFTGPCGVQRMNSCIAIPTPDERCPAPDLTRIMMLASSGMLDSSMGTGFFAQCCASNNECGIDYGMGCTNVADLCAILPKYLTETIKPATCDGKPLALPTNCGVSVDLPMMTPAAGAGG